MEHAVDFTRDLMIAAEAPEKRSANTTLIPTNSHPKVTERASAWSFLWLRLSKATKNAVRGGYHRLTADRATARPASPPQMRHFVVAYPGGGNDFENKNFPAFRFVIAFA